MNLKGIKEKIQKEGIISVDLKFVDLNGELRKVTVSSTEFNEKIVRDGIGFDGSSVTGFRKVSAGDLVLIPNLDSFYYEPFSKTKVASFLCDIKEADTREQFKDDPSYVTQKAVKYLKDTGIADIALFAPEYEFYLFSDVNFSVSDNYAHFFVDSEEGYWNSESIGESDYLPIDKDKGYHRALPFDRYFEVRESIIGYMKLMGIEFKYHHHEVGGPSQHEIEVPLTEIFKAAKDCVLIKYIVKNVAAENGLFATFMPKPLPNDSGSGLHCHIQLKKNGKNIFYNKNGYGNLSKIGLNFIGGILHHCEALCAFTNPSVNSFKRLVPGFEAPTNLFFSVGNRSAAIRIPKYSNSEEQLRFEFRTPDATCNPFFAFSAILMAGIDGVKNKIDPTRHGFGPFDMNIFDLSEKERKKIKSIPQSFEEALYKLEKDYKFLTDGGVFSENLIDAWITTKTKEIRAFKKSIDPLEYKLYFNC